MYLGFSGKNYDTDVAEVTKTHLPNIIHLMLQS